ncbi:hypothetical protein GCK72_020287 [Caenorhabditis remanei]|uniref:Uncharacterized protein n=1 Tax=Caenorhabditis remanei TaxID=31234 RepID=A0A6A5GF40_CAERE|nr:hypothetical protein GCK72_020287 [Caenorhabditis remanei]KAF1753730.1 hypothetical protein GCK72_020287 [Caenorhabditis remanei]
MANGAPVSVLDRCIIALADFICCNCKRNKITPAVPKEVFSETRLSEGQTGGVKRSPTPGAGAQRVPLEHAPEELEVPPPVIKVDEKKDSRTETPSLVVQVSPSIAVQEPSVEPVNESGDPEPCQPEEALIKDEVENIDSENSNKSRDIESIDPPLISPPTPSDTHLPENRPKARPDGAGIRSRAGSLAFPSPFPEYPHSDQDSQISSEQDATVILKELEEDELDIEDWGEGFESNRTPRPDSPPKMQSGPETKRKRGIFQNKKSQAIETPPSSDRKEGRGGEGSGFFVD